MATRPVSLKLLEQAYRAFEATKTADRPGGNYSEAARKLGIHKDTFRCRVDSYFSGRSAEAVAAAKPSDADYVTELADLLKAHPTLSEKRYRLMTKMPETNHYGTRGGWNAFKARASKLIPCEGLANEQGDAKIRGLLRGGASLDEIADRLAVSRGAALDAIDRLKASGTSITEVGERYILGAPLQASFAAGRQFEYRSRKDNWFVCGVVGDTHLCSKYERLDVLNSLYDIFAQEGVDRVFHCGNMIDGYKAGINDHDVKVIGMDDQIAYLVQHYPARRGLVTYAVSGDDHEGWYAQKLGIDVGKRIEQTMREAKRNDWVDLGYMEAHVKLTNAVTGKAAILSVVHPGGGSSYADSYTIQKIIESYEGGEKPAVGFYGHYHKMLAGEYRNVWWVQPGCTEDQTPFARKKKLRFVIGGCMVWMKQDPETGAIIRFKCEQMRYFNRGYYNDRWSHAGPVVLPDRGARLAA